MSTAADLRFEWEVELDEGFRLGFDGAETVEWKGYRVRYRPLGTGKRERWRRFLVDSQPDPDELHALIRYHYTRGQ